MVTTLHTRAAGTRRSRRTSGWRQWARPESSALTLNFAYGINITKEFSVRCRSATDLGHAVLSGHRWLSNRRGVATVVPCPGSDVHGVLWALSGRDLAALDLFEGVHSGLYTRTLKQIQADASSKPCWCWVYQATDAAVGEPRRLYIEAIMSAAEDRRFPRKYVQELRAWAAGSAPALNQERARALPALLSG